MANLVEGVIDIITFPFELWQQRLSKSVNIVRCRKPYPEGYFEDLPTIMAFSIQYLYSDKNWYFFANETPKKKPKEKIKRITSFDPKIEKSPTYGDFENLYPNPQLDIKF